MSGAKDVPRAKDGRIHTALPQKSFALRADLYICLHHGRRMGNAQINEVLDARLCGGANGAAGGDEVDAAEFGCFRRAGMSDSDQLNEGVGRLDLLSVGVVIKSIAKNRLAAGGELMFGAWPCESADFVTAT